MALAQDTIDRAFTGKQRKSTREFIYRHSTS